jgi:hypothetical protein
MDAMCALKTRDHQMALLNAMTDEELAALMRPGEAAYLSTLPDAEILALDNGDPEAQHRFETGYKRWRSDQGL